MPNYEQKEPVAADASSALSATVTVVPGHDGADAMSTRSMTVVDLSRGESFGFLGSIFALLARVEGYGVRNTRRS
jgi:hypothetical protein